MSKSSLLLSALLLSSCQPIPTIEDASVESLRGVETTRLAVLNARDVNAGLVIGTLVRREKPIQGSTLTRRLRDSATYVREGIRWRMLQYHRSPMPVESIP